MKHAAFVLNLPSLSVAPTTARKHPSRHSTAIPCSPSEVHVNVYPSRRLHVSHDTAAAPALATDRVAILWLRVGHLRLADNPAIMAASTYRGSLLPVLTIQRKDINESLIAAVADLASRFQSLGTVLIARVTDSIYHETELIYHIAERIAARRVIVNLSQDFHADALRRLQDSFKLDVWNGDMVYAQLPPAALYHIREAPLSNAPQYLPRPPHSARGLQSDLLAPASSLRAGELAARNRLTTLLRSKAVTLDYLFFQLAGDLRLGCLAGSRVKADFYSTQPERCNANTPGIRRRLSSLKTFFAGHRQVPAITALSIAAYDVNGGDRRGVEWDETTKTFVLTEWEHQETERRMKPRERAREFMRRRRNFFFRAFFPDGVTPDYYSFTAWRFAQRCVSATIGVFGTSSLLFALGIRSGRIGQAAVISWVLKDGLGRVGKMLWAGSMGKDFDVDPKRWRFRSALLYALGNGLEIVTQIFPASFLVLATLANSMKQVSMLTSSATRNAMYRSFGGRSQNIANITAKGEAQIVVADLIGMACGIRLSKFVSASRRNVLGVYSFLTVLDIIGIYMELRQVVFRTVNAERSHLLIQNYLKTGSCLAPSEVSPKERIFLKPVYEGAVRLSSIAKAAQDPRELDLLLKIYRREHFMVSVPRSSSGGPCRVVLRKDASNEDVLRAILTAGYVQQAMKQRSNKQRPTPDEEESILRSALKNQRRNFQGFFSGVREAGWNTDNLLFSTLKRRGYWRREA